MKKSEFKFEKFKKALAALEEIYLKPVQEDRSNIDATIQRFEFTFELGWKFLKDYFEERDIHLNYPKEVIQESFAVGLVDDEEAWIQMLRDRNMTSHTYDQKLADEIYRRIRGHVPAFKALVDRLKG